MLYFQKPGRWFPPRHYNRRDTVVDFRALMVLKYGRAQFSRPLDAAFQEYIVSQPFLAILHPEDQQLDLCIRVT